jgi:putative transposase
MIPQKGSRNLRRGRVSIKSQRYLVTTAVEDRWPAFTNKEAADIVLSSLNWLEKEGRIRLDAAVVMPNHLHFVASLRQGSLAQLMLSLKSYTAKKINLIMQREGAFWQPQYHDHAIRQDEDLYDIVLYILNNPIRAGLVKDFHEYPFWYCRWDV